jgi:hypothetical protein
MARKGIPVDTEILNSGPTLADILTQKEVAALTRIPLSTLRYYRHIGTKGPRSFLLGNRVVYRRPTFSTGSSSSTTPKGRGPARRDEPNPPRRRRGLT